MRPMLARMFRLIKIGAIGGLVVGAVRMLLGRRQPPVTGEASWPTLAERAAASQAQPSEPAADEQAGQAEQSADEQAKEAEQAEEAGDEPDEPADEEAADGEDWVEPVDGACPATHPVKGKPGSGIYHEPGGLFYDRTVPQRCYRSAEAAEADGLRAAKR